MTASGLPRLVWVMHQLRQGCPWDAAQTHESLVRYLVEETMETVEAIEDGDDTALLEELGDLLLQVVFHSEIAAETGRFTVDDVAERTSEKLIARHPYVFTDAPIPEDLTGSWEQAKAKEKGRNSVLDGIPERLSALTRAQKVLARARDHGLEVEVLPQLEVASDQVGEALLGLVDAAQKAGLDAEQELRRSLRGLEQRIGEAEAPGGR